MGADRLAQRLLKKSICVEDVYDVRYSPLKDQDGDSRRVGDWLYYRICCRFRLMVDIYLIVVLALAG